MNQEIKEHIGKQVQLVFHDFENGLQELASYICNLSYKVLRGLLDNEIAASHQDDPVKENTCEHWC